jgi:hypothetical protein
MNLSIGAETTVWMTAGLFARGKKGERGHHVRKFREPTPKVTLNSGKSCKAGIKYQDQRSQLVDMFHLFSLAEWMNGISEGECHGLGLFGKGSRNRKVDFQMPFLGFLLLLLLMGIRNARKAPP